MTFEWKDGRHEGRNHVTMLRASALREVDTLSVLRWENDWIVQGTEADQLHLLFSSLTSMPLCSLEPIQGPEFGSPQSNRLCSGQTLSLILAGSTQHYTITASSLKDPLPCILHQ